MHVRHFKKIIFTIALVTLSASAFFLFNSKTQRVEAQSESANMANVYGFAWSSTTGYVSMNCDQTRTTSLYGFSYTGTNRCTSSGAVGSVDYGVNLDPATGAMTGYGWSNNIGWVKFDVGSGTPNYALNRSGGANVLSIANGGTRPVAGWIRFCSNTNSAHLPDNCGNTSNGSTPDNGGWNGWVAMTGANASGSNPFGVTFNTITNKFAGFAWGGTTNLPGSEVVGWLNFDGVVADLTTPPPPPPTTYIPVVKLDSVSPILAGGDTNITYTLQNAPPTAPDALISCTPFTNGAVGTTRDWSTISINPLPSLSPRTESNIWVWAPSTTYYLDCKNTLGVHAADPTNPTVQCDRLSPATTCPRTQVDVISTPTNLLILEVKPDGAPDTLYTQAPSGSPLIVNPNDAVTLRWSSPQNLTNCVGFSDVGVVNWAIPPTGTTKGNLTAPNDTETGVQTQSPSVTYQVSCMNGATPVTSNTSTVRIDTSPEPIHLSISLDTPVSFNPFGVAVPSNQNTIRLEWWSNAPLSNCVGESIANTNWNNSTVIVSGGGSGAAVQRGAVTLGSTTAPTTYAIRCGGNLSSNSVVATPLVPDVSAASISGPGCVKNTNVLFELNWWTNLVAPTGSCTLSNSDAFNSDLSAWNTTHNNVASDGDHWVSPLRIDGPTTFYLQCTDDEGGLLPQVPKTVVVDPNCSDSPQRSWRFQFFEY